MTPKELDKLLDNPNLISGIHNYCDRWCERCPLTACCAQFAMENHRRNKLAKRRKTAGAPPAASRSDLDNAEFWEELQETFATTFALLRQMMAESGFDPDSIAPEEYAKIDEERRLLDEEVSAHQLSDSSSAYIQQVDSWFAAAEGLFRQKSEVMESLIRMNVGEKQVEEEANLIIDAVEVIRWYQFFIHVKLQRALSGLLDEDDHDEPSEHWPNDAYATAKVALIAIDRSIGAWGRLLRIFRQRETETLEILVQLDRLRRAVEQSFPKARTTVRPGFDTVSLLED